MMTGTSALARPLPFQVPQSRSLWMKRRSTTSEGALAQALRRGEPEALAYVVESYSPRLYPYLLRLLGRPELAEDVLQDTWLRVVERVDRYDPARPFAAWLFTVARHCAIDALRRQGREARAEYSHPDEEGKTPDLLEQLPDAHPSALERLAEEDLCQRVENLFGTLPAIYREVLSLRFPSGLQLEEIARVLGIPLSTVKTRLQRGLGLLRQRVEGLGLVDR